ncbi:hypothetical protein [Achromobacter marplatensis]|uniref:hypothetical protein n=1 Tax=Achromobacter marplatensis TaxID=470868 RepID=UPI0028EAFF93|nr:hypothetical protein [Achromobacter marplatensis]
MKINERLTLLAFLSIGLLIAAVAVLGGVRTFSPVPFWDMWDGYLAFYLKASQGDGSVWWAQHNEHRILWSRVLFWIDIKWFDGAGAFLIVMNYVLAGIAALVFCRLISWSMPGQAMRVVRWALSLFVLGWVFLWCQSENFTWGFQSQFFLAQLLPLCALVVLYRSAEPEAVRSTFVWACLLGLASMGTMANGIIVLPLMVLCAALLRIGVSRILVLLALTAAGIFLYLHQYVSHSENGESLLAVLAEHPVEIGRGLLVYLGSPFFYLMRKSSHSVQIAAWAGAVLLVTSVYWGLAAAWRGKQAGLRLALLTYLVFIGGTALATAIGRLQLGPDQILSSRYSTPAIMAWAAFLVLLADSLKARLRVRPLAWLLPLLALYAYAGLVQVRNLPHPITTEPQRQLAALALTLGARDDSRIGLIYPYIGHVMDIAARASRAEVSIFGSPALRGVRAKLGTSVDAGPSGDCSARIEYVHRLEAGAYDRISGWARGPSDALRAQGVWLIGRDGNRVGYALASSRAASEENGAQAVLRYEGYVAKADALALAAVQVAGSDCTATLALPSPRMTASAVQKPVLTESDAGVGAVLANDGWTGLDYERSAIDGLRVLGSIVRGDSDVGTIRMKVRSGESVLYRSGPNVRSQFLQTGNDVATRMVLPSAESWVRLEFNEGAWPAGEFEVTFTDAGTGFGEWSAIALRADR